ncbi:MAG TPA: cytidylate kinase-like family protein [Gaiellaceae bacterium]|nr:cytidylate kinase-like family protein [Gaiellaceae bacterium]
MESTDELMDPRSPDGTAEIEGPPRISVVCLAHAEGARGEEIGQRLADRLGFRYADDEIVVAAAEAAGAFPEAVSLAESRSPGRWLEVDFNRFEKTEDVRELIRNAVVETAADGDVVIVSHAASFALEGRGGVLRVRITASSETRERQLSETGLDGDEAARRVKDADKDMKAYLKHFYGVSQELPTDYDLVVNSDRVTAEQAVEAIVAVAAT